jgi:hypothetical protein
MFPKGRQYLSKRKYPSKTFALRLNCLSYNTNTGCSLPIEYCRLKVKKILVTFPLGKQNVSLFASIFASRKEKTLCFQSILKVGETGMPRFSNVYTTMFWRVNKHEINMKIKSGF